MVFMYRNIIQKLLISIYMNKNSFDTELKFTQIYRKYQYDHPAIREAMCLDAQYPDYFADIKRNDLFVGRISHGLVGFSPDEWGSTAFGYYCRFEEIEKELSAGKYTEEEKKKILEMMDFWKNEDTSTKLRNSYPELMVKFLPSDGWMNTSGVAFPLYRLTGGTVDFNKLLQIGIPGLYKEINTHLRDESIDINFYLGMKLVLNVLVKVCNHYADQAIIHASKENDSKRKNELIDIADTLSIITVSKPKTFREALQLFWLYSLIGDVRNYGRMDVYMGDFYFNDINAGILTEDEALKMLQSLWKLMADRKTVVHGRVIIGGVGRPNELNADRFAMLAMEASRTVKEIEPQLSLRLYEVMNPLLLEKALDVLSEGRTFPILYNDDININAVMNAFGFSRNEAEQYVPYGCGEYILEHKSFGTPSGVINLLKALEITLRNGLDKESGKVIGLQSGELQEFDSFDKLWSAYKKQVEFFVNLLAEQEALEYKIAGETSPFLFMSLLYDDCLKKGKGIFSGGIKYLGGTVETYGTTNTADSLTTIKELLFDKKEITPEELLAALDSNFTGHEIIRRKLLNQPKFGNDYDTADDMFLNVHNHICKYVRSQASRVGLHSYLVVNINNSANSLMGRSTAASPDGRLAFTPMNNGNTPTGGSDKEGITALLNSIVKPDPNIHAGVVHNLKFSKDMLTKNRAVVKSLLKTYFQKGGTQAMITVVNRGDLEKALIEPENYKHVFVRVGGFTARFVELSRDVQSDIISRTLY